jgi:hypothetical protein
VTLSDARHDLALRVSYGDGCSVDRIVIRGRDAGTAWSGIKTVSGWSGTNTATTAPRVSVAGNRLRLAGISYGLQGLQVSEDWTFTAAADRIDWTIARAYRGSSTIQDCAMPAWEFTDMSTWKGGMIDNGGVVICRYLPGSNASLGTHAGGVTYWNPDANDFLRVTADASLGGHIAARFTHEPSGRFSCHDSLSPSELVPAHDLNRYLSDRQDLWTPFKPADGASSVRYTLTAGDYRAEFDPGELRGVDRDAVRELLNTVARYGVIDDRIMGGNGWLTGYVCLHEQWFGQMGQAIQDPGYVANLRSTLDSERDLAVLPDGRVLSRWDYNSGDSMPGSFRPSGYYECQWGYTLDSQPDYVMCVSDEFDENGDLAWLSGQKRACEAALDYMLRRDAGDGLMTVMSDSYTQGRSSDWLDTIFASWKNALVNAEMFNALSQWAQLESLLGDAMRASAYRAAASRLKRSFNRSVSEGGFWDPDKGWYAYWREPDGTVHGDNLVVPVNFCAIAYGLCDDSQRQKRVLDRLEAEMRREDLFHWPLCVFPFEESAPPDPCLAKAKWIWDPKGAQVPQDCWVRKSFDIPASRAVKSAQVEVSGDDRYELSLDGRLLGSGHDWTRIGRYDVGSLLTPGHHLISVHARNDEGYFGIICGLSATLDDGSDLNIVSDGSWDATLDRGAAAGGDTAVFRHAQELGNSDAAPWHLVVPFRLVQAGNSFPFPRYENGDIFLSWGELGVRSYCWYKPEIAVAYVRRLLERYRRDGLAFQRYLRGNQQGSGEDVLAGNCMALVGLYRDVYGIQPKWDRLYLDPHLTADVYGTKVSYLLRGQRYRVELGEKQFGMSVNGFGVSARAPFAVSSKGDSLQFFDGPTGAPRLIVGRSKPMNVKIDVQSPTTLAWRESAPKGLQIRYTLHGLKAGRRFLLRVGREATRWVVADATGSVRFLSKANGSQAISMEPASR